MPEIRPFRALRYAAERSVGIVLWHAYPEGRDDGPGLTTVAAREELFRNCQKAGVKLSGLSSHTPLCKPEIGTEYLKQAIRYCKAANGMSIAWTSIGDGAPLVLARFGVVDGEDARLAHRMPEAVDRRRERGRMVGEVVIDGDASGRAAHLDLRAD